VGRENQRDSSLRRNRRRRFSLHSPLSSQTPVIPNAAQRNEESPTHFVICNGAQRNEESLTHFVICNGAQRNEESPTHFVICNEAKRSDMSNPEGLDAVNLFITGYLFFVPKRSKSA